MEGLFSGYTTSVSEDVSESESDISEFMSKFSVPEDWREESCCGEVVCRIAAEEFISKVASESLVKAMAKFSKVSAVLLSEGEIFEQFGSN